jgi:hypothetical protein
LIINADARAIPLADRSVQCVVTSPPYWGLRDYGNADRGIGMEATLAEFLESMVAVFSEVRRVLRDDGVVWLNMGDSYAATRPGARDNGRWPKQNRNDHRPPIDRRFLGAPIKAKDLIGQPWRLAFALQEDGWYLRSDIVWHKPNPMPESVRDRPTKSHEYVFLLSKCPSYYYDAEAIAEECSPNTHARVAQDVEAQVGSMRAHAGQKTNGSMKAFGGGVWRRAEGRRAWSGRQAELRRGCGTASRPAKQADRLGDRNGGVPGRALRYLPDGSRGPVYPCRYQRGRTLLRMWGAEAPDARPVFGRVMA